MKVLELITGTLTRSKDTSDFLIPKIEARYLTSSALASPSVGGAEIAMPTASLEISMDSRFFNNNYAISSIRFFSFFYREYMIKQTLFLIIKRKFIEQYFLLPVILLHFAPGLA